MYSESELKLYQNFDHEYSSGSSQQIVRLLCLSLICLPYITSYLYWDWHYFLVPFTNWTLVITTLSIILSFCAGCDKQHFSHKFRKKTSYRDVDLLHDARERRQAVHHLVYTVAIMCNFVVMSVYWTVLHSE